jgi:hypothetical protein
MMSVFMIDDDGIAALKALREKAEANPLTEQDMRAMMERVQAGDFEPHQRLRDQTISLPYGYTVTFTVEWQPIGICRHVSMASRPHRMPIPAAMDMMIEHLGFKEGNARDTWAEHLSDDRIANNLVELVESEDELSKRALAVNT